MAGRPVWAEIDLGAVRDNVAGLAAAVTPAELCAVVKAWAYGHEPVEVARAAIGGGASWLGVALAEEGGALRAAGVDARVLVLAEPPLEAMPDVVRLRLTPVLYTSAGIEAAAKAVAASGSAPLAVHLKVDTGMHRVGAPPHQALALAMEVADRPELRLEGLLTHFAVADDVDDPFTSVQEARLRTLVDQLASGGVRPPLVHACNTAGALAHPASRHQLVRCGIAVYGVAPSPGFPLPAGSRPVLSLRARVSSVRRVEAGEGISYGLRYRTGRPSTVATVPIGYADGVPWRLGAGGGEALLGGRRRPIAGSVTMDQLMLDCGDDDNVAVGDEVVLLGRQGDERIDAWEWAQRAGTIAYEVLCNIGRRVPRVLV